VGFVGLLLVLATVFCVGLYFIGRWLRDTGSKPRR
jgi:hypothetical protein